MGKLGFMQDHQPPSTTNALTDRFGRTINYLRISVTDRCDLRCSYCMPRDMRFLPREQILSLEEIGTIAESMIQLGVDKIRISGGEPLVRRNIISLFDRLGRQSSLRDLTLTTNGTQLRRYARPLRDAGVTRINISLDTLQPDRFARLTRIGDIRNTLDGIDAALEAGFDRIKLNSVIMRNQNHDEVLDLVGYAIDRDMDISFIEEMPLGINHEHDRAEAYYSSDDILDDLSRRYELLPCTFRSAGPARYYQLQGQEKTRVGFISPHSHNFCSSCNRVRLTSEGRLLLCLGQEHSVDLRRVIRNYPGQSEILEQVITDAMALKPRSHEFDLQSEHSVLLRHINMTGG